jgi:hypothetical protein
VKSEKRRVTSFGRAASAARFLHFAKHWQNGLEANVAHAQAEHRKQHASGTLRTW